MIPKTITLDELIDNALYYAAKIEFYDENHPIAKENGKDTKGYRDSKTRTIFIRNNLEEPLKEITIYHELHHAIQTNKENDKVGINQESNIGRLIMEAQTQYFAEVIYQEIHSVHFEEKEIPSEQLRMLGNGTVISSLHNYEMYDNLLTKLSITMDLPKIYFVSINYLFKDNIGLKDLEQKYEESKRKYNLPYEFNHLLLILDYIYCVDLLAYKDNPEKRIILNGEETANAYEIHPHQGFKCSLQAQKININAFDSNNFLALLENGGNFKSFSHYIIDNTNRQVIQQYMETIKESFPTPKQ